MRKLYAVFLMMIGGVIAYGQTGSEEDLFYFTFIEDKLDESNIELSLLRGHYLGETAAKKLQLLQDAYTYEQEPTATSPVKQTIVEKPDIYYALKKLSNSYKKKLKSGEITEEKALEELTEALNIGLFIRNQNTTDFENKLREFKTPEEIAQLFTEKVQLK
ncbi:MAG: hypothetical protein O2887_11070 [Bacteroidetes bacterium]|nr:hypothetical protein [Bacteroidota bacterium]